MGKLLGIDFGGKRTGIAETDELKIIASPLKTIATETLLDFLIDYLKNNQVDAVIVGKALRWSGEENPIETKIKDFLKELKEAVPNIIIHRQDESDTSKQAVQTMIMGGMKKSDRRKKENVDLISAVIILQNYMEENL